jgi:hypothetical protein
MEFNKEFPIIFVPPKSNQVLKFAQTDSEDKFYENREKLGSDWYYYDKDIEYNYNSWGYRSKEFAELDNEYMVVFGCSFTEGIGLHYDDIWATKLSKKLNVDVFNLGIGGSGPDVALYNTILFHNFVLKNKKWTSERINSYTKNNLIVTNIDDSIDSLFVYLIVLSLYFNSSFLYPKNKCDELELHAYFKFVYEKLKLKFSFLNPTLRGGRRKNRTRAFRIK